MVKPTGMFSYGVELLPYSLNSIALRPAASYDQARFDACGYEVNDRICIILLILIVSSL